ncbi:MAG TPA: SprT family zinc-dependent metalloprotease [Hyphomicrobiaceae bacterium]|nr:SprT family zinc-dependent metalloprotease [Hyphomicrobiaceae bacterium]
MARHARSASSHGTIDVAGIPTPVEIRRHPSARRLTLRVSRTDRSVVLTVPNGSDLGEAGRFAGRHADWVRKRLESVPSSVAFVDGAVIPVRGIAHSLRFSGETRAEGVVVANPTDQGVPAALLVSGRVEHAPRRLLEWLMREACRDLDASVLHHAGRLGLRPRRITVRDQRSRWGSCSSTGRLAFSWRLILAPTFVLDYVAAHEVAHLAEMNHGPRFWSLVEQTCPATQQAKAWLSAHGTTLHGYGPPS